MKYVRLYLIILSVLYFPIKSLAGIDFDPMVYGETLAIDGQEVVNGATLVHQLTSLEEEASYLKTELNALKQLSPGQYQWSNAQSLINRLGDVVSKSNGIDYDAQNLDQKFKQTYPGYQAPQNYNQQYQNITDTTINTLNGSLQSMGSSAQDFQDENARMKFLQAQSQSAQGQTQAIQASAQIASEQVSQLQLVRQTLIAQTNAQTTYYAAQLQKQASAEAETNKIISNGSTSAPAVGHSGNQLTIPHY